MESIIEEKIYEEVPNWFFCYQKPPIPCKVLSIGANIFIQSFIPLFKTFFILIFWEWCLTVLSFFCSTHLRRENAFLSFLILFDWIKIRRRGQGRVNRWVGHRGHAIFGPKSGHREGCESRGVVVVEEPIFWLPQIRHLWQQIVEQSFENF